MAKNKRVCRFWTREKNYTFITLIVADMVKLDEGAMFTDLAKGDLTGYYGFSYQTQKGGSSDNKRIGIQFTFKANVDRKNWKELLMELEKRGIIFGLTFNED